VWAALTTAEGLGTWFGNSATIDLRPGGTARIAWNSGDKADLRIERIEEPTVFGFTWTGDAATPAEAVAAGRRPRRPASRGLIHKPGLVA
jgi:uncharacterized protein YndB with AHSA1/START domain